MNKTQKGFTLIELLVVIGIIGILAALVLVALGNARNKANDARVKSNVGQLRTLAEIHYDNNASSYANVAACLTGTVASCEGDIGASVTSLIADTTNANGEPTPFISYSTADRFCVKSQLNSSEEYVCVDQTGQFNQIAVGDGCTGPEDANNQC